MEQTNSHYQKYKDTIKKWHSENRENLNVYYRDYRKKKREEKRQNAENTVIKTFLETELKNCDNEINKTHLEELLQKLQ